MNSSFTSTGSLKHSVNDDKIIVEVESEICNYYRSLIPKYYRVNRQRYAPHISVVRDESILYPEELKNLDGRLITFWYSGIIHNDETYFWLEVNSWELQEIRVKLGLTSTSRITRSPDGNHSFHITLGNLK